jgi:hypothetical protein
MCLHLCWLESFRQMAKSGIALSQGRSDFSFLRHLHTDWCTNGVPVYTPMYPFPHPPQEDTLVFLALLMMAILTQEMDSQSSFPVHLPHGLWLRMLNTLSGIILAFIFSFWEPSIQVINSLIDRISFFGVFNQFLSDGVISFILCPLMEFIF